MAEPTWTERSVVGEDYREYDFAGRLYHIVEPQKVCTLPNGELQCVIDVNNVGHAVPAPGIGDCVMRWKNRIDLPAMRFWPVTF